MKIHIRNGEIVGSGNVSRTRPSSSDERESSQDSKRYECPHCGVLLETGEPIEGTRVACPECGKVFVASPYDPGAAEAVKPPSAKKRIFGTVLVVVALLFILARCSGGPSKSDGAKETVKAAIKAKVLDAIADMPCGYDVNWLDDALVINLWADSLAVGAVFAASGNERFRRLWNTMKAKMLEASNTSAKISSAQGFEVHIMCNLFDSGDLDTPLLSTLDGAVVYDATLR
jgi:DNA-directed RNA polymerase subunit RPC12/RpoP